MKLKILLLTLFILSFSSCKHSGGPGTSGNGDNYPGGTNEAAPTTSLKNEIYLSFKENFSCSLNGNNIFTYSFMLTKKQSTYTLTSDGCTNNFIEEIPIPSNMLYTSPQIADFPQTIFYKNNIFELRRSLPEKNLVDESFVKIWCYSDDITFFITKKMNSSVYKSYFYYAKENIKDVTNESAISLANVINVNNSKYNLDINLENKTCIIKINNQEIPLSLIVND